MTVTCWSSALRGTSPFDASPRAAMVAANSSEHGRRICVSTERRRQTPAAGLKALPQRAVAGRSHGEAGSRDRCPMAKEAHCTHGNRKLMYPSCPVSASGV